jgi:hypothetical protein
VAGAPLVQLLEDGHVVDELEGGEAGVEPGLLRHVAEPATQVQPLVGAPGVEA